MSPSRRQRYDALQKLLHWSIAGLIVLQYVLARLAEAAEHSDARLQQLALLANHKSVGITILALAVARLCWRALRGAPPLPLTMPAWQRRASHASHFLLYALLFTLPLSGWLMSSASAYPVSWFGLFQLPDLVTADADLKRQLLDLHEALAKGLFIIAVVHIGAALKHGLIDRDGVLARISSAPALLSFAVVIATGVAFLGRLDAAPSPTDSTADTVVDTAPVPTDSTADTPVADTAPVPTDSTAAPVVDTAPVPTDSTADTPVADTAPVPTDSTAAPVVDTAPVPTDSTLDTVVDTAPLPTDSTADTVVDTAAPVVDTAPVPTDSTLDTVVDTAPVPTDSTLDTVVDTAPVPTDSTADTPIADTAPPVPTPAAWSIDHARSQIEFSAEQAGARFTGRWSDWQATLRFDPQRPQTGRFEVTVQTDSASTGDAERDAYLADGDWFDHAAHPNAMFVAEQFERIAGGRWRADGQFRAKGRTTPLTLEFTVDVDDERRTLRGNARIDRLAADIGTGEWADTEWVGQFVDVSVVVIATVR